VRLALSEYTFVACYRTHECCLVRMVLLVTSIAKIYHDCHIVILNALFTLLNLHRFKKIIHYTKFEDSARKSASAGPRHKLAWPPYTYCSR
jgi:hypothetical protein